MKDGNFAVACLSIGEFTFQREASSRKELPVLRAARKGDAIVDEEDRLCGRVQDVWDAPGEVTPWIASVNATRRTWVDNDDIADIVIVKFGSRSSQEGRNAFMTCRVRLKSKTGMESPANMELRLVNSASTPVNDLPWYPQNVSHSGRMFAIRGNMLHVYDLFSNKEQPGKILEVPALSENEELNDGPTINTIEPWSETVAVELLRGRVSMLRVHKPL